MQENQSAFIPHSIHKKFMPEGRSILKELKHKKLHHFPKVRDFDRSTGRFDGP